MSVNKLPVAGNDAAQVLRPGTIEAAADDDVADLLFPQLLRNRGEPISASTFSSASSRADSSVGWVTKLISRFASTPT
jgi:hypothetical protein